MEAAHAPRSALWPGTAAALHGTQHAEDLPARAIRPWARSASLPSGRTDQKAGIVFRYLHAPQTSAEPNGFLRHPSGRRGHGGKLIRVARHVLPGALAPGSAQASKRWPTVATWWPTMRAASGRLRSGRRAGACRSLRHSGGACCAIDTYAAHGHIHR